MLLIYSKYVLVSPSLYWNTFWTVHWRNGC